MKKASDKLQNVKGFKELTKEEKKQVQGGYSAQNDAAMKLTLFFARLFSL